MQPGEKAGLASSAIAAPRLGLLLVGDAGNLLLPRPAPSLVWSWDAGKWVAGLSTVGLPGARLAVSGPSALVAAGLVETGLVEAGQIRRGVARWIVGVVAARAGLKIAVRRAAAARPIIRIWPPALSARARPRPWLAEGRIARRVGAASLGAGRARNSAHAARSNAQVRVGRHPGLAAHHASAHPAHGRHALGLRLPMVEHKFPLVKILAVLVDLDASFFDLAGDSRYAAGHAGTGTLHLLPPGSPQARQSARARLRQQVADDAGGLAAGALRAESHRLPSSGAAESTWLPSAGAAESTWLIAARLAEAPGPGPLLARLIPAARPPLAGSWRNLTGQGARVVRILWLVWIEGLAIGSNSIGVIWVEGALLALRPYQTRYDWGRRLPDGAGAVRSTKRAIGRVETLWLSGIRVVWAARIVGLVRVVRLVRVVGLVAVVCAGLLVALTATAARALIEHHRRAAPH